MLSCQAGKNCKKFYFPHYWFKSHLISLSQIYSMCERERTGGKKRKEEKQINSTRCLQMKHIFNNGLTKTIRQLLTINVKRRLQIKYKLSSILNKSFCKFRQQATASRWNYYCEKCIWTLEGFLGEKQNRDVRYRVLLSST